MKRSGLLRALSHPIWSATVLGLLLSTACGGSGKSPEPKAVGTGGAGPSGGGLDLAPQVQTTAPPRLDARSRVSLETVVDDTAESLRRGYEATELELRQAGLGDVVDDIKTLDGIQIHDIEAEELTREIVRRAEAHTKGQGDRVLARLYKVAADRYPAVAQDPNPNYERLRKVIANNSAEALDPNNFKFASATDALHVRLSPPVENAVRELAHVYAQGDLPELSRISLKAFGPTFSLGEHLARAKTTRGALLSALAAHGPPPPVEDVVRTLMRETSKRPAAAARSQFQQALAALGRESTGFDPAEDGIQRTVAKSQDTLPSRVAQREQAASIGMPGGVEKRASNAVAQAATRLATGESSGTIGAGSSLQEAAQRYSNYVSTSFESPTTGGVGGASGGGGGGGGVGTKRRYTTSGPSETYTKAAGRAISSPVPRRYSVAIRSARAARGVAAGADLRLPEKLDLKGIGWVANPEDDRFGRIIVQVGPSSGPAYLARSRTLFSDSFEVALDVLWGGHYGPTAFHPGELLVLMSMDPFAAFSSDETEALDARRLALMERAQLLKEGDAAAKMRLYVDLVQFRADMAHLPRRVVLHPSLHGRELSWSAARIDFSFNDLDGLSDEAQKMNGGKPMPPAYRQIDVGQASTWQFYERSQAIRIERGKGPIGSISVVSTGDPGVSGTRSHYSVSMFAIGDEEVDDQEGQRIEALENELQPMLDWLAVNHPDFIRLNDFSEAFALLRWASVAGVQPVVFDLDGEAVPIATPDRVVIGDGPKVK